jgi:hypothetical protein
MASSARAALAISKRTEASDMRLATNKNGLLKSFTRQFCGMRNRLLRGRTVTAQQCGTCVG